MEVGARIRCGCLGVWLGDQGACGPGARSAADQQIYFALVLYAYALHLRHGTYWRLPLSKSRSATTRNAYQHLAEDDDEVPDEAKLPDDDAVGSEPPRGAATSTAGAPEPQ